MDMIHVADIARANLLAATTPIGDEVLNVASGSEVSLLELARLLARVMGRRELTPEFATRRMINRVARRVGDTTAARQALGFTATISLEEGLRDLVAWWRCERRRAAPAPMALTAQ
jgi:UDP-glucose 4-epimerase